MLFEMSSGIVRDVYKQVVVAQTRTELVWCTMRKPLVK